MCKQEFFKFVRVKIKKKTSLKSRQQIINSFIQKMHANATRGQFRFGYYQIWGKEISLGQ